jgi:hypothetical protein
LPSIFVTVFLLCCTFTIPFDQSKVMLNISSQYVQEIEKCCHIHITLWQVRFHLLSRGSDHCGFDLIVKVQHYAKTNLHNDSCKLKIIMTFKIYMNNDKIPWDFLRYFIFVMLNISSQYVQELEQCCHVHITLWQVRFHLLSRGSDHCGFDLHASKLWY